MEPRWDSPRKRGWLTSTSAPYLSLLPRALISRISTALKCPMKRWGALYAAREWGRRFHLRSSSRVRLPSWSTNTPSSESKCRTAPDQSRYSGLYSGGASCRMATGKLRSWVAPYIRKDREVSVGSRNAAPD
ncbi:unnamed protein product, partial [Ixodes pacificus]